MPQEGIVSQTYKYLFSYNTAVRLIGYSLVGLSASMISGNLDTGLRYIVSVPNAAYLAAGLSSGVMILADDVVRDIVAVAAQRA